MPHQSALKNLALDSKALHLVSTCLSELGDFTQNSFLSVIQMHVEDQGGGGDHYRGVQPGGWVAQFLIAAHAADGPEREVYFQAACQAFRKFGGRCPIWVWSGKCLTRE